MTPVTEAYLANKDAIKRYVYRFIHSTDDTEDIIQEAFIRAYKTELKRPIDQAKSFLFRIAKHITLSRIKSSKLWSLGPLEEDGYPGDSDPEAEIAAEQAIDSVLSAIRDLSPVCREVYLLRRYEGLSQKEAAQRLGITVSTLEKHMIKATKRVGL
jgi:RNA polymerase sigma factor (sigma-70 family)